HYVVREALEVQAARLFATVATPQERTELQRLAARVDALSAQPAGDRFLYLTLHEKLHRRIAEGAHCQPLCDAIEKNQVLASTWLCAPHKAPAAEPARRHQELVEVLVRDTPEAAAMAMGNHIRHALNNTLTRLESYFQLRETSAATYTRGAKRRTPRPPGTPATKKRKS
ncbi:MAG: FCD domain-containing protein, partial [Blastocatellia bacterium]